MKTCTVCNLELPLSRFYSSGVNKGLRGECKTCSNSYKKDRAKQRIAHIRQQLNSIKTQYGCMVCGYNQQACALDFHHMDNKSENVSNMLRECRSKSKIRKLEAELSKCVILCSVCHRCTHHSIFSIIAPKFCSNIIFSDDPIYSNIRTKKIKFVLHKKSGLLRVWIAGKYHYLCKSNHPDPMSEYKKLLDKLQTNAL